ncbi:methylase [Streptomyces mashuensis]|uniref:peptide chain release factor N(5)-glutamine methyltransferase n=1 Tax=Streptomyces mashuensis TaxID=33904 RepID=A0A919ED52_9ACTN|nr:putative protein N(5)-glutamine methyltransferase [Streptomyces mashuensis]GHF45776.1 methylase [Streptomyces mashuensis]
MSLVTRLRSAGCVFAEEEAELLLSTARTATELETMAARRVAGLPLEHVLGWAAFAGLRLAVGPGVFVPRRRTEFLVRQAATRTAPGAVVVDLCCGSGAVGAALAARRPGITLHAADLDPAATSCARRNLAPYDAYVHEGDLYAALPPGLRGTVDVLVANAPYVPTSEIPLLPPEARDHEPHLSLDGGPDGLTLHRRVAESAQEWLAPTGHLLIETSTHQAAATAAAMKAAGLRTRVTTCEELDATVVIGQATPER